MKCIIFQNKVEIDHFSKKFNISDFKIIAWNSEVIDELDRLNLDYICAGSIYKKKFNVNERINLIKKYGKINNLLDEIILKDIPLFKKNNIRPFNSIASLNRNFFLSYIMDIDLIFNLKKNFSFKKVFYFEYLVEGYSGLLSKVINLYDNKNKGYFKKLKINLDNEHFLNESYVKLYLENKVQTNFFKIFFKNIKIIFKRILKYDDFKNHTYTFLSSLLNIRNEKKNILAYTDFNNFDKYKKNINNKNFNLIYWENLFFKIKKKNININFNRIHKNIDNSKILKKYCTYKTLCYYDLLKNDLKILINDIVPKFWDNYIFYEFIDQKFKFKAIISEYNFPTLEMILNRTKNTTPIFIELHGGSVGVYNAQPFQYDYNRVGGNLLNYFVYTNSIEKKQKKNFRGTKNLARYHGVGSIHHEQLYNKLNLKRKNINNKKINICLVVTQFSKVGDNTIGIYREVNTYRLLKSVLDLFENNTDPKFNFFLKCGYEIEKRNLDIFKNYKKTKILSTYYDNKKMYDFCDVFILPSFSSIFFEISCSKKTILMNIDQRIHSFDSKAKSKIFNRANISLNEEAFLKNIKNILNNGNNLRLISNHKNNDLTFYKSYCNDSSNTIRDRLKILD